MEGSAESRMVIETRNTYLVELISSPSDIDTIGVFTSKARAFQARDEAVEARETANAKYRDSTYTFDAEISVYKGTTFIGSWNKQDIWWQEEKREAR